MALDHLQPSQLYISAEKLRRAMATLGSHWPYAIEPIPIKRLGDHVILTDWHTRAFAAWLMGRDQVPVCWDEDELDWEAYEICVRWCEQEQIHTIADLEKRVLDQETYQRAWLDRCAAMHRALQARRNRR